MRKAGFKGPVILELPSDPLLMSAVRGLTEKICNAAGIAGEQTDKLVLAVDEACTNVIRHAYGNRRDGRIKLSFLATADRLEIAVRDFGAGTDPAMFRGRDLSQIRPGGLGMHFIESAADNLEIVCLPGEGMVLKMVKFIRQQEKTQH
ncbi:MAG: ATP-binding protein [Syntrophobacteraceae bacterium]